MSRRNGTRRHATLYDFRDLDLMLKIDSEGDAEGWVEAGRMADSLGFGDETSPIARRLAWMKRYGMLEYDDKAHLWRLSPGGRRVADARVRASAASQIEKLPDEAFVEVMASVTTRYWRGDPMTAHMLRREFLYGTRSDRG